MLKTRKYGNFTGVDFSNSEVSLNRSPYLINMWKNYKSALGQRIETRPGLELQAEFPNKILGFFFYRYNNNLAVLVHSGTKLLRWTNYPTMPVETTELFGSMNIVKSQSFIVNNIFYIKDGINYLEYDGITIKEVEGFIPTTTIERRPKGGGTLFQKVNVLTPKRKNSFVADGTSAKYVLDTTDLDSKSTYLMTATVDGITKTEDIHFTVDRTKGEVTFNEAPNKPLEDDEDNVIITISKTTSGHRDRINKCRLLTTFDNRVFFSGNQDFPNVIFHSELDNPRYISDLAYYNEGMDLSPVKALVTGNNALWVFKAPNQANTTVFYHTPVLDYEFGKVYPSVHSNISTGCVSTGINFNDDIVFFSERGLEGISGDINSERVLGHRSSFVDAKLINETGYLNIELAEYEGYLMCLVGSKVYLADSRQRIGGEYEWFYWELPFAINFITEIEGKIYFGNDLGAIYTLNGTKDGINDVVGTFRTINDDFGAMNIQKTTNKRGGVADVIGQSVTIKVKTDNKEWETIGTYNNTKGYIVYRIKEKKFKDIQIEFSGNFGLIECTLEAFIGGYVKR
jgi:hypothetical protein